MKSPRGTGLEIVQSERQGRQRETKLRECWVELASGDQLSMKWASFRFYNCRCLLTILMLFLRWQTMCQQCLPKTDGFSPPHFLFIQTAKMLHKAENKRVLSKHIAVDSNRMLGYFNHRSNSTRAFFPSRCSGVDECVVRPTSVVQNVRRTYRADSIPMRIFSTRQMLPSPGKWRGDCLPKRNLIFIPKQQRAVEICSAVEHNDPTKPKCEPVPTLNSLPQRIEHKVERYYQKHGLTHKWHCAVENIGPFIFITFNKRKQATKFTFSDRILHNCYHSLPKLWHPNAAI